jgi:hypothetical protein
VKIYLPESKINVNVLNLSDKIKTLDLLKGGRSLVEVGGIVGKTNQASTVRTELCLLSPCTFSSAAICQGSTLFLTAWSLGQDHW